MKPFLTAEWKKIAMANYAIDPVLLEPYVPNLTTLDVHNGRCYVSLVGFMFLNTKVKGFRIPYHINFEEINLRFYLKYGDEHETKRGVGFIKEIVPKPALTMIANLLYKEKYVTLPTKHKWTMQHKELQVGYQWKTARWNSLSIVADANRQSILPGSEEEFILEHYWGYTKVNEQTTFQYKVEHPPWEIYPVKNYTIDVDFKNLYGNEFAFLANEKPVSVFLAEGSEIAVYDKTVLKPVRSLVEVVK
jgi:uncharacterized protein